MVCLTNIMTPQKDSVGRELSARELTVLVDSHTTPIAITGPSAALSPSTTFPVSPVMQFSAPWVFSTGRGGLLQLLKCPCHRAVAIAPPERLAASVSLQRSVLLSLLNSEFGPWA